MKYSKKHFLLICVCLFSFRLAIAQFAQQPPFKITIEPVITVNSFGLHSFAFAQSGSKWLIIGGRTNGLHGLNANDPFAVEFANNFVTVVDTVNWQVYKSNLSVLPKSVADPLRSTNMQYVQNGNYLYMVGGYGRDSVINKFVTFPVLSKIHVDSLIDAVINQAPIAPTIRQISDTNLRICGGELHYFDNHFYLMFGHDFNGRYANPFVPIYTQYYRSQLKKFDINDVGNNLSIANYQEVIDTNNFHRRDMNVVPIIKPNGDEALMAYAGVFQKTRDIPYFEPILIEPSSYSVLPYTQVMSHYTCAHLPLYDSTTKKMHTVFFGGMSFNDYEPQTNLVVQDTNVPFISDVTCFTLNPNQSCEESIMPLQLPGLLGSNAKFVSSNQLTSYANGVVNVNDIQTRKLAGYLLGGIRSDVPNLGLTGPNDTIYRVFIEPNPSVSLKEINNDFVYLTVFPNPTSDKLYLNYELKKEGQLVVKLLDLNAKQVSSKKVKPISLKGQLSFDTNELTNGVYIMEISSIEFTYKKKVIISK